MKSRNRKELQKVYGRLYSRIDDGTSLSECAYCGSDRECLDHVPPLSWVECLDLDKFKKKAPGGLASGGKWRLGLRRRGIEFYQGFMRMMARAARADNSACNMVITFRALNKA